MDRSAKKAFVLILVVLPCGLVFADPQLEIGPDLFVGNQPRGSSFIDPTQALINETYTLSLKVAEYLNILIPADSVVRSAEVIGSAGLNGLRSWKYQGTFSLRCYQFAQIGLDLLGASWDDQSVVYVRIEVDRNAKTYMPANSDPLSDKIIERLSQTSVSDSLSFGNIERANDWRGYPLFDVSKVSNYTLPPSSIDYVIITSQELQPLVTSFSQWKASQGIQSFAMTTQTIDRTYVGGSAQSKTLEFLKDAYNTWHMQYVLIVGGENTLPPIGFQRMFEGKMEQITSDCYYMTLEQPTNSYDQIQDPVLATQYPADFPDFILGRFPSDNPTDIMNMVEKTIQYESDNNPGDWIQKKLLVTGEGVDLISSDPNVVPLPSYTNWLKYTEEPKLHLIYPQNLTLDSLLNAINQGVGSVSFNTHANPYGWVLSSTQNMWFDYDHVDALSNTRLTVIFSDGCYSGKWDAPYSVAVKLLALPNKGAVAIIAGSYYTPYGLDVFQSAYDYSSKNQMEIRRLPNADYNIGKAFFYFTALNGITEYMNILGDPSLVIPAQINPIPEFGSYMFPVVALVLSLTFMIVGRSNRLHRKRKMK